MTAAYRPHADWAREDREFQAEVARIRNEQETFQSVMRAAVRTRCEDCEAAR
jgi:hypothetical protein